MSAAIERNLRVDQGCTFEHTFRVRVRDLPVTSAWSARAQVRKAVEAPTVLHEWSTALGSIEIASTTVDGLAWGLVKLKVAPATSSAWSWASGVYDLEITSPTGEIFRVARGTVTVGLEVTR